MGKVNEKDQGESEKLFQTLAESSPNMIFINQGGNVIYANQTCVDKMGYSRKEFYDEDFDFMTLIAPEHRKFIRRMFKKHIEGKEVPLLEYTLLTKDKKKINALYSSKLIAYCSKPAILGTIIDITERKKIESALQKSKHEKAVILDSVEELISYQDREMRIVWANRAAADSVELSADELMGRKCYEVWPKRSEPCENCPVSRAIETGEPQNGEITTPNGRIWYIKGYPVTGEEGSVIGAVEVTLEITERKRSEEALKKTNRILTTLLENLPGMAYRCNNDSDWTMEFLSEACKELTGYDPHQLVNNEEISYNDLIHPEDQQYVWDGVQEGVRKKRPFKLEYRIVDSDGKVKWVWEQGRAVEYPEDEAAILEGIIMDITERKKAEQALEEHQENLEELVEKRTTELKQINQRLQSEIEDRKTAEEALRKSEEKYRTLLENIPQNIFYKDNESVYISCNENFARDIGLKPAEIVGKTDFDLFPEHLAVKYRHDDRRVLDAGDAVDIEELFIRDGEETWVRTIKKPVLDKEGNIIGILGIFWDITEEKQIRNEIYSLSQFRESIIENANVWLDVLDENSNVLIWNKAAEEISGYSREEVLAHNKIWEWLYPDEDYRKKITDKAAAIITKGEVVRDFETIIRTKGGEKRVISWNSRNLMDEKGKPMGSIALGRDVTEKKRAEEQINRLSLAVKTSIDGILITDLNGSIIDANEATLEMYGVHDKEKFLGKNSFELVTPKDRKKVVEDMREVREKGYTDISEYTVRDKHGNEIPVEMSVTLLKNQDGEAIGYIGIFRDISEKKKAQKALADSHEELRDTNEELKAFAYSVSHDLRAPLRAMEGFGQALMEDYRDDLDPTAEEYITRIINASKRMDELINDLLTYSRVSRGELTLRPVELKSLIDNVVGDMKHQIEQCNADIKLGKKIPKVIAHEGTLYRIIENIISNAIKFIPRGKKPKIKIYGEDRGKTLRLWIEDNGIGIQKDHYKRIFRVFERLHGRETYPGTGIGLAIVKKGVDKMDGRVGLESKIGEGTRFWIELKKTNNGSE